MKILHIPTGGLFSDGISTFIYSYLEHMNLSDLEVTILATNTVLLEDRLKFEALGIRIVEIERKKTEIISYMAMLYRLLKKEKYDIIHVHGSSALMSIELVIAKITSIPVRIAHSHNTTCDHKYLDKMIRPFFYHFYTQAWACGIEAGKWLFHNKPFDVIHNARDVEKYRFSSKCREEFRKKYLLDEDMVALGHVGRFNVQKNHAFLIDLMENLQSQSRNIKLFLVGEGEKLAAIKSVVFEKRLEDKVIFLERFSDIKSFVSAMDIMLLPSLYEGLPLVAIEWQINGIQSLLSTTISDECIFTDSIKQLSIDEMYRWGKAICEFSPTDREKQSIKNIELAQKAKYDIKLEAKNLELMYKKLIREL